MNIDNFKNTRKDRDLYPYESGIEDYIYMMVVCFTMFGSNKY